MALVRIHKSPNLNPWDRDPPDFERIAREWFANYTDPRPSVYEANAPVEEVEAVTAFSLTNPGMSLTVYHLMRIEWSDLEALRRRTQVDDSVPGTTGVVAVDFRHWEIPGDKQFLLDLVRHIHGQCAQGEDRFRWVGTLMQRGQLERFQGRPDSLVIREAKRRCAHKLAGTTYRPRPLGEQLRRELEATPPAIPHRRIAAVAYGKYLARRAHAANPLEDWLRAEQELRDRYTAGILGYTPPG